MQEDVKISGSCEHKTTNTLIYFHSGLLSLTKTKIKTIKKNLLIEMKLKI